MAPDPINERIQKALAKRDPELCRCLLREAESAAAAADQEHETLRNQALDPMLSEDQIERARRSMEDALFRRDRMTRAAHLVRESIAAFDREHDQAARRVQYAQAKERLSEATQRFEAEYVPLANKLGEIIHEIGLANLEAQRVNAMLPDEAVRLPLAHSGVVSAARLPGVSKPWGIYGPGQMIGAGMTFEPEDEIGSAKGNARGTGPDKPAPAGERGHRLPSSSSGPANTNRGEAA